MIKKLKNQKYNKSYENLFIMLLIIFSIFGVVISVGKYITAPWELNITANYIVSQRFTENNGVMVDDSGARLSILDKDKNVVDVKSSYTTNSNMYFYQHVCLNDHFYFVSEYSFYNDSHFINHERIVKYNLDGTKVEDLVCYSYDLENNYTNVPRIKNFSLIEDALYYTYYDNLSNNYEINAINLRTNECTKQIDLMKSFPDPTSIFSICSVCYVGLENKLVVIDTFGNCYVANSHDASFTKDSTNIVDSFNNDAKFSIFSYVSLDDRIASICNDDNINYSVLLTIRILYFWLSIVILLVVFTLIAFFIVKHSDKKSLLKKIKIPSMICICALISIGVIAFLNDNTQRVEIKNRHNNLAQNALSIKAYDADLIDKLMSVEQNSSEFIEYQKEMNRTLQQASLISAKNNLASSYDLCKLQDGKFVNIANSTSSTLTGVNKFKYDPQIVLDKYGTASGFMSDATGFYGVVGTYVYDNSDNVCGAVLCYSNLDAGYNMFRMDMIVLMTGIASSLIVISFLFMEGVNWIKSFSLRRNKKLPKGTTKEISITCPLFFINTATTSADSVIGVLVFSDMLVGTMFEGNMLIVSLPLTFKVIGSTVGVVLFPKIIKKLGTKKTLLISAFASCACLLLSALCVYSSRFFLLSISLFVASLFRQMIWMYLNDVPIHITDSHTRKDVNNYCSASSICGNALITVIAGYASDALGGWTVYICAAVPAFICLVMIMIFIPKTCFLDNNKDEVDNKLRVKEVLKFIFRPDIIILMFSAWAVGILISGYKSFIFPLISSMNGFSNSDVSNICVFANAFVYYVTPLFTTAQKRRGSERLLFGLEIIIGFLFIMFLFNSSFFWACCVYFIAQILNKLIYPCSNDCWQTIAINSNTDSNIALTGVTLTNDVFNLTKNTVMGGLMGIGSIFACAFIGIYSIIMSGIFGFYYRRHTISENNQALNAEQK